jgi:hypothetical protein
MVAFTSRLYRVIFLKITTNPYLLIEKTIDAAL